MFFFTAGNSNDAVRPLRDQVKGIVYAIGISETIALGDHVPFSARTYVIEDFPQPGLIKRQFDKSCDRRTLPKAIGVANNNGLAGDTKHFPDNRVRIGGVMQGCEFANDVETAVWKWQCVSSTADDGDTGSIAIADSLPDQSVHRLDTADEQVRQSTFEV